MRQLFRQYTLSPDELLRLQSVLLELMLEVDRICRKHEINYTLTGGTLLGAVRHNGFIPWDDDADFGMFRSEYEKFKAACHADLNHDKFFLQDNTTDPHYRWGYARLCQKNSEFIRIGQEHMKMKTGIHLDIFQVDSVPDFYPFRVLHALYCLIIRKTLYAQVGMVTGANMLIRLIYKTLNLIPEKFVFRRLDKLIRWGSGRHTEYVRELTFPLPKGRELGYLTRWYTDTSDIVFAGKNFKGIRAYDEYLKYKYGDYMVLPPPEDRHWHPVSEFSLPVDRYTR